MSTASRPSSFFSFGPNDSFISRSFIGLRFQNISKPLQDLLTSSKVSTVNWATLGSKPSSWVISCADPSGKTALHWGPDIPPRLHTILSKTWHSPHLHALLGPDDSFMIWHPELIRWANLPAGLEDAIQSWLTPSGWRVGAPSMVTWGPNGAFFAMSEYGDVAYGFGDNEGEISDVYQETVEEWKAEKGFQWRGLAFITLDATAVDQYVAVRRDGTWGGSIDDVNEDALEEFAVNFWARAKSKETPDSNPHARPGPGPVPGPSQSNTHNASASPKPAATTTTATAGAKTNATTQTLYKAWAQETSKAFTSASLFLTNGSNSSGSSSSNVNVPRKLQLRPPSSSSSTTTTINPMPATPKLLTAFPQLPRTNPTCILPACVLLKNDPDGVHACQHDVERLFRGSGSYGYDLLRQERLRWHPDRFGRLCEESWRGTGKRMAGEMFKMLSALMEEIGERQGEGKGGSGNYEY